MLDAGRGTGQVAQALDLDDGTVYCYAQAWQRLGLEKYLLHEAPGYWGLLPSAGLATLSFAEAAHPTHNTCSTRVWTRTGQPRPLPTVSGRERVNLNAAVNAHCSTQVHLHETDCVNAQRTKALYEKLLMAHPEGYPIYVICDNARYYRNQKLAEWLHDRPLVQVFLPPYSPNLNLIERLWKLLRQKIINPCFYRTKGAFRQAVLSFFDPLDEFGHELASLLTLKFHLFPSHISL